MDITYAVLEPDVVFERVAFSYVWNRRNNLPNTAFHTKAELLYLHQQLASFGMLYYTLVGLCLLANANSLHIDPFAETIVEAQDEMPQSFLDSIYGELVDSPDSRVYKTNRIKNGELGPPVDKAQELAVFEFDTLEMSSFQQLLQDREKIAEADKTRFAEKSHESYMKYRSRLKLPDDDETSDLIFQRNLFGGILTFGGVNHFNCFDPNITDKIDIAILGAPFDTGVSYRPGARFGPEAIRAGSRRIGGATPVRGSGRPNTNLTRIDPFNPKSHNLSIIDCGDAPLTPFDNRIALNQLYRGERAIHRHPSKNKSAKPKIVTIGGDHTVTLMALRSSFEQYGELNVIHFDSHIDTWDPKVLGGGITNYMNLNHGTFLHYAAEQGYINKTGSAHVGLRAPYIDADYDPKHDADCGFKTFTARSIDRIGINGIVHEIVKRAGKDAPVYITVDIDVLDPAFAPATGTMEVGGWSTRELLSVLDGLEGINLVGADVVEVSPPFDSNSEITSLAATQVIDSLLSLMIAKEVYG